ncbi:MAG: prepilin-type N-terminal cleavage/methylation domain-containing protein [bacterium]|nr:prepilin-type N-terminal cleavage/methylation domain-containing protein [bacterium]
MISRRTHTHLARSGFSLLEVLVGMTILTAGVLAVAAVFPYLLRAESDAELLSEAAALAQMKAEEIRRDDSAPDATGVLRSEIRILPQPTTPIVFSMEPRLSYSFSGASLLYPADDPRGTPGVARVIIRYAPGFRESQEVVYELRFN